MAVSRDTLLVIRSWDPDGQETKPAPVDHQRFEARVIRSYGHAAWVAYRSAWEAPTEF